MGESVAAPVATSPAGGGQAPLNRAEAIHAEQVRQLYRLSRPTYAGSLLAAGVIVAALWEAAPHTVLLVWAAALALVMGARFLLDRAFARRKPADSDAPRWCSYFITGSASAGAMWGVLGSALYPAGAMPQEFLLMFMIGGLVIAALILLAPISNAFLAFLLPAVVPIIPAVFLQGTTTHFYMGLLLLIVLFVMLTTGPLVSQMIREAIGMKFENSELLAQLSETHAASRLANFQLNDQVYAQRVMAEQLRQASQKLTALIEASPLAIIVRDVHGRVEGWNSAAEKIFGWSQDEVRGNRVPYYPAGAENQGDKFRRAILNGESVSDLEGTRITKSGRLIDVSVSSALVHDIRGRPAGYVSLIADITDRKRVEHQQSVITRITMLLSEAQSAEEAIPRVLQTIGESFGFVYGARWVLDRQNLVMRSAETWCVEEPEILGFRELSRGRLERPAKGEGLNRRVWDTGVSVWIPDIAHDTSLARRDAALAAGLRSAFGFPVMIGGDLYGVMEFFGREVRPIDDAVLQVAHTLSSHIGQFIARKQAERNLQFVASHDALTGLFNRSMFSQRLQQALAQAHRHERSLAVLFIDLDGFKLINDMLGHDAGDVLLADLANRLRLCMREGDTLGRMGGDEFVVLIEGYEEEGQLLEVAKKVLETVAEPFLIRDGEYRVTASIGIAAYPQDGQDAAALLKHADMAMYRAKQQGKNNYQFHSPQMNTHLVERIGLETALSRALERNELTLFYQPKISMSDERVTCVEGLVRWMHPTQGVINAPEFVHIAEEAGLFTPIGDWVLAAACAQLSAWHQRGMAGMRIAVNLSTRQFVQDNLIERLREAIHSAGIEARHVDVEMTEAALTRHADRAGKVLSQFKELGVQIVIDDFGTGQSSLSCLKRFPIDAIKIDRSLVAQLPGGGDAADLTRAVIAMAHSLNLQVTGEGVETRQQWDFLREHGCDSVQGNHFCAPASAETVAAMLLQQHGALRTANVQQFRPWRARPGSESPPES